MTRCSDCEENPATTLIILRVDGRERKGLLCSECADELRIIVRRPRKLRLVRELLWALVAAAIIIGILSLKDGKW